MKYLAAASTLLSIAKAQNNVNGNCVSGPIKFDASRVKTNAGNVPTGASVDPNLDLSQYDWVVEGNMDRIKPFGNNGFSLILDNKLKNPDGSATGSKITHSRYAMYGRFTATFSSIGTGAVTDMVTMSGVQDEIDWEITGNPLTPQSNVFYHVYPNGEKEIGKHGGKHGTVDLKSHTYVIDWKQNSITWSLDGQVVRTLNKNDSISTTNPSGPKWFPTTASVLQFGVWDFNNIGTWAGGAINWNGQDTLMANYENISIQCYDDHGNEVSMWPANQTIATKTPSTATNSSPVSTGTNTGTSVHGATLLPTPAAPSAGIASTVSMSVIAAFVTLLF